MIDQDKVVALNYTLRNEKGDVIDQTDGEPLHYLHGHKNLIPGFESNMSGLKEGDKKSFEVKPEEGYGQLQPDLRFGMKLADFGGHPIKIGQMVGLQGPDGRVIRARIMDIQGDQVDLDANHPLAGEKLFFEVEIVSIRPASSEEIAHGHVHGPGGHHH